MTTITSKNPSPYYGIATSADYQSPITMPLDFAAFGDKLSYSDYQGGNDFHPLALAARLSPKEQTPHEKRRARSRHNKYPISHHPIRPRLNRPEDTYPRSHLAPKQNRRSHQRPPLRLTCHESFACPYALKFTTHDGRNPNWSHWAKTIHSCIIHLRASLYRESEQTALPCSTVSNSIFQA